ncbi:hypothetical protein Hanom_Chr12g01148971 [Helianthus anomalus]
MELNYFTRNQIMIRNILDHIGHKAMRYGDGPSVENDLPRRMGVRMGAKGMDETKEMGG